jgi:hypothetical protein
VSAAQSHPCCKGRFVMHRNLITAAGMGRISFCGTGASKVSRSGSNLATRGPHPSVARQSA